VFVLLAMVCLDGQPKLRVQNNNVCCDMNALTPVSGGAQASKLSSKHSNKSPHPAVEEHYTQVLFVVVRGDNKLHVHALV